MWGRRFPAPPTLTQPGLPGDLGDLFSLSKPRFIICEMGLRLYSAEVTVTGPHGEAIHGLNAPLCCPQGHREATARPQRGPVAVPTGGAAESQVTVRALTNLSDPRATSLASSPGSELPPKGRGRRFAGKRSVSVALCTYLQRTALLGWSKREINSKLESVLPRHTRARF